MLAELSEPLSAHHDVVVLDLDGVVYRGRQAVPGAADALAAARTAGVRLAFVTNNAARPPARVAEHLAALGVAAEAGDVVTSAQAAVRLVANRVPAGSPVFVIGGEGLLEALHERGLVPVTDADDAVPVAVVQGYGPEMPWRRVVRGAMLVRDGLPWVASNTDMTLPTATGVGPGNGTLVRLVAEFAGRQPEVAGKPEPALLEETLDRVGGARPLMVGDRADTDIEGAVRLGWDSLLVLTGVTGLAELVALPDGQRPTYLATGLAALGQPQPAPQEHDGTQCLAGWRASVDDGTLHVAGDGTADDWWRCVAVAAWRHLDAAGTAPGIDGVTPPAADLRVDSGA